MKSLGDVAICDGGHVKDLFFCTRIDSWHVKVQIFHKKGQIFGFKMVKGKILQNIPSMTSNVSSLIFVDLRINRVQCQSQTVNDNTSPRTQQKVTELWCVER